MYRHTRPYRTSMSTLSPHACNQTPLYPLYPIPTPQRLRACGLYIVDVAIGSKVMLKPSELRHAQGRAKGVPNDKRLSIAMEALAPVYTGDSHSRPCLPASIPSVTHTATLLIPSVNSCDCSLALFPLPLRLLLRPCLQQLDAGLGPRTWGGSASAMAVERLARVWTGMERELISKVVRRILLLVLPPHLLTCSYLPNSMTRPSRVWTGCRSSQSHRRALGTQNAGRGTDRWPGQTATSLWEGHGQAQGIRTRMEEIHSLCCIGLLCTAMALPPCRSPRWWH